MQVCFDMPMLAVRPDRLKIVANKLKIEHFVPDFILESVTSAEFVSVDLGFCTTNG